MLQEKDDSSWRKQLHGYGPQFYLLGPVPETTILDSELVALDRIDPDVPVIVGDKPYYWKPYDFSWRYGKEDDPGRQGYHGLKGRISDNFNRLGKRDLKLNGVMLLAPEENNRYYLWTTTTVAEPTVATLHVAADQSEPMKNTSPVIAPSAVFINGARVNDFAQAVSLR